MDNLGSHKARAVRTAIRAAGARLLFLPKYSPDLNPIEMTFSKIKHWMRLAQNTAIDDIQALLRQLVQTISPNECAAYLKAAGYASV